MIPSLACPLPVKSRELQDGGGELGVPAVVVCREAEQEHDAVRVAEAEIVERVAAGGLAAHRGAPAGDVTASGSGHFVVRGHGLEADAFRLRRRTVEGACLADRSTIAAQAAGGRRESDFAPLEILDIGPEAVEAASLLEDELGDFIEAGPSAT